jgi:hypothetical protein
MPEALFASGAFSVIYYRDIVVKQFPAPKYFTASARLRKQTLLIVVCRRYADNYNIPKLFRERLEGHELKCQCAK